MSAILAPPQVSTVADLLDRLGAIPADRVLLDPPPGRATVDDLVSAMDHIGGGFELIDGALVRKAMGYRESFLAGILIQILNNHVLPRRLGVVTGEQGAMRLTYSLARTPDVAFTCWDRFPDRKLPEDPVPVLAPDLAVEVLSRGNTEREMQRKRREYFAAGCRLVWIVDPRKRTVRVYTAPEQFTSVGPEGTLDGGDVLPGFSLPLRDWFNLAEEGDEPAP
jgi:Uma2 family endonuclease